MSLLRRDYEVWGIDVSKGMIKEAYKTIHDKGFAIWNQGFVGNIEKLEFNNDFFDVVVAAGVIEYQKNDKNALMEMNRVLRKDGYLILNVTNKYSYVRILENSYRALKRNAFTRNIL